MALTSVATKSTIASKTKTPTSKKNTSRSKVKKQILVDTLLTPTNPYELLSERINSLDIKIDATKNELSERINSVDIKIDATKNELSERINNVDRKIDATKNELSERINSLDRKIDSVKNELLTEIKNTHTRIDSFEKNTNSKFNLILVFMGIGFSSILGLLGVMLSKML